MLAHHETGCLAQLCAAPFRLVMAIAFLWRATALTFFCGIRVALGGASFRVNIQNRRASLALWGLMLPELGTGGRKRITKEERILGDETLRTSCLTLSAHCILVLTRAQRMLLLRSFPRSLHTLSFPCALDLTLSRAPSRPRWPPHGRVRGTCVASQPGARVQAAP